MQMAICSPDQALQVDREVFEEQARTRFPEGVVLSIDDANRPMDVVVQIGRTGEPEFQILRSREGEVIFTDGTPKQAAEVALWIRSLLPDDPGGRIWLVDEGYSGHVELVPGMTAADVKARWVEHNDSATD
jgi:hypothetical protein